MPITYADTRLKLKSSQEHISVQLHEWQIQQVDLSNKTVSAKIAIGLLIKLTIIKTNTLDACMCQWHGPRSFEVVRKCTLYIKNVND